jgi:hypothetical protein
MRRAALKVQLSREADALNYRRRVAFLHTSKSQGSARSFCDMASLEKWGWGLRLIHTGAFGAAGTLGICVSNDKPTGVIGRLVTTDSSPITVWVTYALDMPTYAWVTADISSRGDGCAVH